MYITSHTYFVLKLKIYAFRNYQVYSIITIFIMLYRSLELIPPDIFYLWPTSPYPFPRFMVTTSLPSASMSLTSVYKWDPAVFVSLCLDYFTYGFSSLILLRFSWVQFFHLQAVLRTKHGDFAHSYILRRFPYFKKFF